MLVIRYKYIKKFPFLFNIITKQYFFDSILMKYSDDLNE